IILRIPLNSWCPTHRGVFQISSAAALPSRWNNRGNIGPIIPQIEGGKVHGLFVTADERMERLEDVPTVKELGLPELTDIVGWSAIVGPPDMDQSVIDVLEKGMQDVKDDEEWIAFTEKVGSVSDIR